MIVRPIVAPLAPKSLPWEPTEPFPAQPGSLPPFNPATLSGMVLWLRADRGIVLGTGVQTWQDQSGNGHHFTQSTGSKQPAYTAGARGVAKLTFDGVDDILANTDVILSNGAYTAAVKSRKSATPGAGTIYTLMSIIQSATRTFLEWIDGINLATYKQQTRVGNVQAVVASVGYDGANDTSVHSYLETYGGSAPSTPGSYADYLGGAAQTVVASGNVARTATDKGSIGGRLSSLDVGTNMFAGDLYEIIIYNRVLTAAEIALVNAWLT